MKRIFKNIFPYQEALHFIGTIDEFKAFTRKIKKELFLINWLNDDTFRLTAWMSSGQVTPISCIGKVNSHKPDLVNIQLSTPLRFDHLILIFIFSIIGIIALFFDWSIALVIFFIGLVAIWWFSFISRGEEIQLILEFKKYIYRHHLLTGKIKIDKKHRRR